MAADIFFTESRAWSVSSAGFEDFIDRAINLCPVNDQSLVQVLSDAKKIRCLSIDLQKERDIQITLTELVLKAARETLQELCADPATHPEELSHIEELVATAQVHLRELGGSIA